VSWQEVDLKMNHRCRPRHPAEGCEMPEKGPIKVTLEQKELPHCVTDSKQHDL
jgi:hypothetical protein